MNVFDKDWDSEGSPPGAKKPRYKAPPKCYESHPRLSLGGGTVIGGSCSHPVTDKADIYIGLESGMKHQAARYPWAPADKGGPIGVLFPISDMCAPKDVPNFIAMIEWLEDQLAAGKTVHVGCMGGHGRTGLVLAALVKTLTGNADAITWVRENYCKRAVESKTQVEFLHKHFGIDVVAGTKSYSDLSFGAAPSVTPDNKYGIKPRYHQDTLLKREDFADRYGDFIPGTHMPRTRGPRDLSAALPLPKVVTDVAIEAPKSAKKFSIFSADPDSNAPENIWKKLLSDLTNANK